MKKLLTMSTLVFILTLALSVPRLCAESKIPFPDLEPDISMDFQDAGLKDVLKVLSIQAGMNFIANQGVQDRKLTLYLDKVPLREAMDKIFSANNLSYELDRDSNVFIVKDWGKPGVETVTKVFYLKHATVSTSSMREEANNEIRGQTAGFASTSGSTTTTTSTSTTTGNTGKWKVEDEAGITRAVKKLLSDAGSVMEDFRTNSLIVTDTPQRMSVVAQVIAALDVQVPQVMLEVEMLDVSKNALDKMGVSWKNPLASLTVIGTRETSFPFGSQAQGTSGFGRQIDGLDAVTNMGAQYNPAAWAANKFGPSILTVLGQTVTFDFLKTYADAKILARPRIMTVNNETAEIRITTEEAIGSITSQTGGTNPLTTSQAERVETGVSLRVTPQIDEETGEITMLICPRVKDTTPSTLSLQQVGELRAQQLKDPEERSTKSIVRVKDGETVILGGLIRNDKSETETKVPVFGDWPIVGSLFRHKDVDKNKERELLVFITPHIQKDSEVKFAQAKKVTLPEREQTGVVRREREISSALSGFER